MSKKVLILSGSPRKNGNSDILYDEFMKGARDSGNEVEKIRVSTKKDCALFGLLPLQFPQRRMCSQRRYGRSLAEND